ncbi:uncharacterized protein LOC118183436 [Stegodyphus dumicola]|uniref:uncharacterized protein LOC118183436 n=1 Tax=Stegodyphus dumicola TaxID=202533 RepID=UPI0015B022A1|nr:uncharacterized protein LOC118183436 [Stegodyphus dumicola]
MEVNQTPTTKPQEMDQTEEGEFITHRKTADRVLPIIISDITAWKPLRDEIKKFTTAMECVQKGGDIHIKVKSDYDYRLVTKFLDPKEIPYHTFRLPRDKPLKIVIKKLSVHTKPEEILDELQEMKIPVKSVRQITKKIDNEILKFPTFLIEVPRTLEGKTIYQVNHILDLAVKITSFKPTPRRKQCHNCQRYGHSRSHCKHKPRCLKYGQIHITTVCK